jgi:hypothetical protein
MQLKAKMEESGEPMSVEELIQILQNSDINIDKSDIYDLIKKEPLVNIISAIEGDNVIFKGQKPELDQAGDGQPGEFEKTRQAMASKQASKLA